MGKDLIKAAKNGDLEKVKKLLQEGAYVDERDNEGKTALMYACNNGHLEIVDVLIKANADLDLESYSGVPTIYYGMYNLNILKKLVENGINVDARDSYGDTLLAHAISFRYFDCARYLINEAKANVNTKNKSGCSPISRAVAKQNSQIVADLIKAGAMLNVQDGRGYAPLHSAVFDGNTKIVDLLIKGGANIEIRNNDGITPLIMAVLSKRTNTLKQLIRNGSNINAQDKCCDTALHVAAKSDDLAFAKILIDAGADVNIKNRFGYKPIFYAKDEAMRELLQDKVKKINIPNQHKTSLYTLPNLNTQRSKGTNLTL